MDFQKGRAKWQHSIGNGQRLNPRLTTTFASITQPVAIRNTFAMLFRDNFRQWSMSDTKNQRANTTKVNFPIANCKIRKKNVMQTFIHFINNCLIVVLATKYRLKENPCYVSFLFET